MEAALIRKGHLASREFNHLVASSPRSDGLPDCKKLSETFDWTRRVWICETHTYGGWPRRRRVHYNSKLAEIRAIWWISAEVQMVGEKIVAAAGGARYARDQGPPPDGAWGGAFSFGSSTSHTHLRGCWDASSGRQLTENTRKNICLRDAIFRRLLHSRDGKKVEIPQQGGVECLIRGNIDSTWFLRQLEKNEENLRGFNNMSWNSYCYFNQQN